MPILILILTAIGGALWYWIRTNPRDALDTASDVATTLANAPRRLAFRRQTNAHPVEGIDDPRIALCAIAQAFLELDDLPTQEQRQALHRALRTKLRASAEEAQELESLGHWLVGQCQTPAQAIPRLGKRLRKLNGDADWDSLQDLLAEVVGKQLSSRQIDAVEDLRRVILR